MSDTIIGALIAFISASLGAGLTAIITWKSAKLSVNSERDCRIREEKMLCFSRYLSAYHALFSKAAVNDKGKRPAYGDCKEIDLEEFDLFTQFQTVYSNAILICSQPTISILTELLQQTAKNA